MNLVQFWKDKGWRVTSGYGNRTYTIKGKKVSDFHQGIDFGGKKVGEPVCTPYAGTVRASGYYGSAGNGISIKSAATGLMLCFFHLNSRSVKPGDKVKAGDVIGKNGATGNVTGPHVHFEIRYDDGTLFGTRPAWGDPAKYNEEKKEQDAVQIHRVGPGEYLTLIAKKHGVTVEDLITWNRDKYPSIVTNPSLIRPGWELIIGANAVAEYEVKSGDSMYKIAKAFGVELDKLITANPHVKNPSKIYPGDVLYIPGKNQPKYKKYTVVSGDNLTKIAEEFNTTITAILKANPQIKDKNKIYPRQELLIPRS